MSKNKKKTTITIVGILVLVIAVVGTSYAIWNYVYNGTLKNTLETADISLEFLESNTNIITVENALPMGCTEGKQQEETFDFAVTSTTTRDTKINYTLTIEKLSVDTGYTALNDNQVALYLTNYDGTNELTPSSYICPITSTPGVEQGLSNPVDEYKHIKPMLLSSSDTSHISLISQLNNYKLYSGTHTHNSSHETVQDKFKLRVWIAEDVDASSWNASTKLQYKFKIGITSEEKQKGSSPEVVYRYGTNIVKPGASLTPATITKWIITDGTNIGPGPYDTLEECQTAWEGYKTQGMPEGWTCQQKTETFEGFDYSEDYTTLNKNYFLKHNISSSGTVESSEVCYILNNTLYCLKGGDGGTAYSENTSVLQNSFGQSNCSVSSYDVYCSASGLDASADRDGSVGAGDASSSCGVHEGGVSFCGG